MSFKGFTGGLTGGFKSLLDKQTLMLGAGAVGGGLLSGFILNHYAAGGSAVRAGGFTLPLTANADGSSNKWGLLAYSVGIPVVAAYGVKKFSPQLAKGLLLGAVITLIQNGYAYVMAKTGTVAGTAEYLSNVAPVGALPPGYSAVDTFGSIYNSEAAFASSAWGN